MEATNTVIYKTKNYDIFKYKDCNRKIGHLKVKNLIKSIKKENYLHLQNITVNEDFEVLDGQHRLEAAKFLNLEIFYAIIKEEEGSELIALLNANQAPWVAGDFLNFWINHGKTEYIKLKQFMDKNKFNITQGLIWAKDGSQYTREEFKKGNFVFANASSDEKALIYANHYIKYLKETNYKPIKLYKHSPFHKALKIFFSSDAVDNDFFIKKATEVPFTIRFSSCEQEYVSQLVEIYNYKLKLNKIMIKTPVTHIKIIRIEDQ